MNEHDPLPAGYVVLEGVAIHVSQLRRHTTDPHRFRRFLPFIEELEALGPGTPAWKAMVRTLTPDEIKGVRITLDEHARLSFALAEDLQQSIEDEA